MHKEIQLLLEMVRFPCGKAYKLMYCADNNRIDDQNGHCINVLYYSCKYNFLYYMVTSFHTFAYV